MWLRWVPSHRPDNKGYRSRDAEAKALIDLLILFMAITVLTVRARVRFVVQDG